MVKAGPYSPHLRGCWWGDRRTEPILREEQMNLWDRLLQRRDEERQRVKNARAVVCFDELPWEINSHGKMKWYMHPDIEDTANRSLLVYLQEIPPAGHTGKLQHQGGIAFYVWKGRGYTILNEQRHDWEQEDVIVLPVSVEFDKGITYQHFNTDPHKPTWLLAAYPNVFDALGVDLGIGLEQLENSPDYEANR